MPLTPVILTPEEQAEFDRLDAGVPAGAKPFDPVASLDATGLAELADKQLFDPIQWATKNSSAALEPANLQKLADANAIIRQKGFQFKDLPTPKEAVGGVAHLLKGAAKVARNIGSIVTGPIVSAVGDITGQGPEFGAELANIVEKQASESVAGIEQAGKGLVDIGAKAGGKLIRKTVGTNYGEMTPEQRKEAFLSDLGNAQVAQQVAVGQGPFTQAVAGEFISDLEKQGVKLDPNEIADLSAGDPISFIAFGSGFKLIGKAGRVLGTAPTIQAAEQAVGKLAQQAAGKTIQAAGGVAEIGGKVTRVASPMVPAIGAARATRFLGKAGEAVGGKVSQFGEQVAGEAAVTSPYAQAIQDALKVAPPAIGELAKGAGLDIGLAAASSETPQETQAMSAFGTLFGVVGAAGRAIRTGVQGQLLTARPWGTAAESKPYGSTSFLDAEHARAQQALPAEVIQRANTIREFLRSVPGDVQAYLMPDKAATEAFLVADYTKRTGAAPTGAALESIRNAAQQRGMINYNAFADDGSQKRIVLLNDVEAAPHEAFHGIQDVLGDSGNQAIDRIIFDQYFDRWESIGENYAQRLAGGDLQGKPWRDVVVERTNTDNPDRYMAREIAAENFDTVFKNLGGSLTEGNALPQKLARVVANMMNFFGVEPFSGAQTAGLRLEPNFGVTEEVKRLVGGITEEVKPTVPPLVTPKAPPAKPVVTPTAPKAPTVPTSSAVGVSPDAKAAQDWAASKSDPRLVNIVNSIVANQVKSAPGEAAPIRLKYLSVAGTEGSTRTPRRSEQEAAYLKEALGAMPAETRQEVEKTHAHVRFDSVKKGNEMQSIGYSLEKLVENAQRAAKWLSGNESARAISPYEIDTATGSFTPEAWKNLVSDIQTYAVNQQAGGTGAGKALVQPANAAELKISVPPVQAAKFIGLEQPKADFINTLMGFKLPETVRVSRAGGTPGNIVGQEISKANEQPFIQPRVSEPAVQRAGGKEFPGFPGRTIQEVNPLRKQLEAAGFPVNELTEVVERVNLKHLESITPAPESSFRPGVTDTIRAGFLPPAEKPKWVVKGQKGGLKIEGVFEGADMGEARRKAEAQGYRVSTVERTNPLEVRVGFLPAETEAKQVEDFDQRGLQAWSSAQVGGFTSTAHRVGREATSQAFTDSLRDRSARFKKEASDAIANDDFNSAMVNSTKAQFFREAWEAAAGVGSAGEFLKQRDTTYKAPFPESEKKAFLPSRELAEQGDKTSKLVQRFRDIQGETGENPLGMRIKYGQRPDIGPVVNLSFKDRKGTRSLVESEAKKEGWEFNETSEPGAYTIEGFLAPVSEKKAFSPADKEGPINEMAAMAGQRSKMKKVARVLNELDDETPGLALRIKYGDRPGIGAVVNLDFKDRKNSRKEITEAIESQGWKFYETSEPGAYGIRGYAAPAETKIQFSPADEPRTGLEFKKFFSDVTKGNFGKSDKPFEPVLDLSDAREAIEARSEHTGNFDDHIAKSIPTFYEAQIRKAKAIAEVFGDKQTRLLDIAASEGSFGKSVSDLTGGVVETVSLDPNPDMAKFFREKSNAPRATYAEEAFLNGFEDAGKNYPAHNPETPYDVITEAMGFQFIDKNRAAQLDEAKRLLKPDGVFLTEEKVRNPDWARNEKQKDTDYKSKYFSTEDLAKKDARVGFAQSKDEVKSVGMVDNMVEQSALEADLKNRFKHVVQYWDSGNFKGYIAGDNAAKVDATVSAMGDLNSDFSTVKTPRTVQDAGAVEQQFDMNQRAQFLPYSKYNEEYDAAVAARKAGKKSGLTGWVLPNNKFVPLSQSYHEQYLAENSADLNKQFGTKFTKQENVEERQQALDKGFVRMRMQGGTLHVEAGQAGWTKAARDRVFETIADNLDNIDQIQVSLLDKNGIVKRQGHERLMDFDTDAEKLNNIPLISEGRSAFLPAESENLPGLDVGREFNRAAINQMNRAELRKHFPEAIVPRSADELINSDIVGSPLAKQEGGRPAAVEAFANTLVDFYNEIKDQPEAKAGASWYSDFTPRLKKEFGKDAPIMAELLAATSPQTNPQVNFGYAFDALEGFKAGKYDKQIAKFNEGLERLADGSLAKIYDRDVRAGKVNNAPEKPSDATYLAHWIDKHNLVPRGSSDKLFGTHSIRVLQVLARKWLAMNAGPKTSNFVQNLLGTASEATIDLWADRTMRRIGYAGFKDRWRILPENGTGVSDEDFSFSQEAFRAAANKLGIKPSALQGALWFGEKKLWSDEGWGRLDLGDYRDELRKVSLLRAGVKQREEATRLGRKAGSAEQEALDLGLTIEPKQSKFKQ